MSSEKIMKEAVELFSNHWEIEIKTKSQQEIIDTLKNAIQLAKDRFDMRCVRVLQKELKKYGIQ